MLVSLSMLSLVIAALSSENIDLALYHLTPERRICRCGAFDYAFLINNTGPFNETYSFSVDRYPGSFNISPSVVTLRPGKAAEIGIGARLPCSLAERNPEVNFVVRTRISGLKAETPFSILVNSSCLAPGVSIASFQNVQRTNELARLISFFFIAIVFLLLIALMFILIKRPQKQEYWWKPYFELKEERAESYELKEERAESYEKVKRKVPLMEILILIIVLIFLIFLGLKGFSQIGGNGSLITTYLGVLKPLNVTLNNVTNATVVESNTTLNINISPVFAGFGSSVKSAFSSAWNFLWSYKLYASVTIVLLALIVLMSVIVLRKRSAVETERLSGKAVKESDAGALRTFLKKHLLVIFLILLIAFSSLLVYLNRARLSSLPYLMPFFTEGFSFLKQYVLYVFIGLVLLVLIIFFIRKRESVS